MRRYDPATALIVVDVQNDFADPAGSLSVAGGDDIVPTINGEIADGDRRRTVSSSSPRTGTRSHAAFREGRRPLAGPLRGRHVGRGTSTRTS